MCSGYKVCVPPPTGSNLDKYTLLEPHGGCKDFLLDPFSTVSGVFNNTQLNFNEKVDYCAGWCLQNGPPQYKMIGFETYSNAFYDSGSGDLLCSCQFDDGLPVPVPTYSNPNYEIAISTPAKGQLYSELDTDKLCYALNPMVSS